MRKRKKSQFLPYRKNTAHSSRRRTKRINTQCGWHAQILYVETTNALCYGRTLMALYSIVQARNCTLSPLRKRKLAFEILSDASISHETGIELDKRENSFNQFRLVYSAEIKRQRSIGSHFLFLRGTLLAQSLLLTEARIERSLVALEAITDDVLCACVDKGPTPSTLYKLLGAGLQWRFCKHSAGIRSVDQSQGHLRRN